MDGINREAPIPWAGVRNETKISELIYTMSYSIHRIDSPPHGVPAACVGVARCYRTGAQPDTTR